ncbi:MAG: TM2 domain-containing protein [Bacteroidia bacterium]|nr:TM2 domain-containing protein [Bacteroidia bacterium]
MDIIYLLPELEASEMFYIKDMTKDLDDKQTELFAHIYRARRKDPQLILLTTLLGFAGIAGVQRFLTGQIGMGILYFFTGGLCLIGTIVDLVNYKMLAWEFNRSIAMDVLLLVKR